MQITQNPQPVQAGSSYRITVSGGTAPYAFDLGPVPPNPPGVTIDVLGDSANVTVPPGTPPGSSIQVQVQDSGSQSQSVANQVR